jgi:hypothetical protein
MYDPATGDLNTRIKSGKTEATDTKYTKVGDYYIPTSQKKNTWDTNDHLAENAIKTYATVLSGAFPVTSAVMNAGVAANNGNWTGAAMSMIPAAGQYGQIAGGALNAYNASKRGDTMGLIGGLAGAAAGASNMAGSTDTGSLLGNVSKGSGVVRNLQNGNLFGALQGGASLAGFNGASQYAPALSTLQKLYSLYNQSRSSPAKPVVSSGLGLSGNNGVGSMFGGMNSLYNNAQGIQGGPVRTVQPLMFGKPTGRG